MKWKSFIAVAALASLAACETTYQATDTGVVRVSESTQRVFVEQYPNGRNVAWSYYDPSVVVVNDWDLTGWEALDASDYVVRFDMDGEPYYAWYNSDGTWVGTAYVMTDHTQLPSLVRTSATTKYPAYTISSINREYYKDRMLYEITMKDDKGKVVLLVDAAGNIVKEKVKYD